VVPIAYSAGYLCNAGWRAFKSNTSRTERTQLTHHGFMTPTHQSWYAGDTRGWTCEPPDGAAAEFHRTLPGYAPTPLIEAPALAAELGVGRLFLKDESARFDLRAFKFLGASWAGFLAVAGRTGYAGPVGLEGLRVHLASSALALVTATDGNHGRAVARTARLLGLPARVYVPNTVPGLVIDRIRAEGAAVIVIDANYDGAVAAARADAEDSRGANEADANGGGGDGGGGDGGAGTAVLIQDTAWPGYEQIPAWIVAGYETLFAELDAQLAAVGVGFGFGGADEIDGAGKTDRADGAVVVSVPVGVGSLAQAAVAHYRSRLAGARSRTRLLSVEPDTAACVLRSLADGVLVSVPTGTTIMNGLNCGTPSSLAWPYLRNGIDAAVTVTDGEARDAIGALGAAGVSAGPSGAAALAGPRAALTGPGAAARRRELGLDGDEAVDERAIVICLSTEGPLSA
jgi:diaminopropionate ammonia-lyase